MLTAAVGAAATALLYHGVDREIRRRLENKLGEHYRALKVRVGSAELVEGEGIRVRNVSIVEPGADGPCPELLAIDEAMLECPTQWKQLLQGDVSVRRVKIRRSTLRVTRRPDGSWSVGKLLPPPQFGDVPPEVVVEDGAIEIFDPLKTPAGAMRFRDMNLRLVPIAATTPGTAPGIRQVQGALAADGVRRIEMDGWLDVRAGAFSLQGQAEGIELSPELRASLPGPLADKLRPLPDVRGQANLRFQLAYDPSAATPWKYNAAGRVVRGRIDDAHLPHALTDLRADVRVADGGYAIENLTARSGQAAVRLTLQGSGLTRNSPLRLSAEIRQADLDRALLGILPPWAQEQWYNYLPAGQVDADVKLAFDGETWQPELSVRCLDVSFTYRKFPYRLEHGKGALDLKDDRLTLSLTAYSGTQPVRLDAEVANPFSGPTGWLEAKGDALAIDEPLMAALSKKPQDAIRSLNPRGTLNFFLRLWRDQPGQPLRQHLRMVPNRCSVCFSKFPYTLSDIRGLVEMVDGVWQFNNLEAVNDRARITCDGRLGPGPEGHELTLHLAGRDVTLGEELRDALNPNMQQVWRDLQPRGTVDLNADIRYFAAKNQFSVGVEARPQPQNTSIEPVRIPYRLDRIQGKLTYRDGRVAFERCEGWHGDAKVAAEGYCDFLPDRRWMIHFAALSADRLRLDRELIQALPARLRKAVEELRPTGTINLQGRFDVEQAAAGDDAIRSQWDMRLGLFQSNLRLGEMLAENIAGSVWLRGESDGRQFRSRGQLALDAVKYKDCQLTQLAGPIWIDDRQVLFGEWVDRQENLAASEATGPRQTPRPVTARLFDGTLAAHGWITLGAEPLYGLDATLSGADLARCAQEVGAARQNFRGTIDASIHLKGAGRTRNTLSGSGAIGLSNADVYQLPVMLSMLKLLSIRPPDQNAFSDASINYRIEGEHIYFDRIDFRGDAISLRGQGEMDFQSAIRLQFFPTFGRGEVDLPLVKQIFRGASQQIMQIHVEGTLQDPVARKEALPGVNQMLQQLPGED